MVTINRRRLLASGFAAGGLAALGRIPAASAEDKVKIRFVMPTTPADYLLPYFVAHDLGWLDKQGVDVDEKVVIGDVNAVRALLSGGADVGFPGVAPILSAVAQGADLKIISSWQPVVDYMIVVRAGLPTDIATLADRKWATYGPGGLSTAIPTMLMKKHGLNASQTNFLAVGDQSSRLQAVVGGKVDATILDSYVTTRAERAHQVAAVTPAVKEFPGMGNCFLVAEQKTIADPKMRRALVAMVRGGIEGSRLVMKDPDKAAELMLHRLPNGDIDILKQTLRTVDKLGIWGVNGGIDREVIDYTVQAYRDMGELPRTISYEELVDPSLVAEAMSAVGKFQ